MNKLEQIKNKNNLKKEEEEKDIKDNIFKLEDDGTEEELF
jgi:hypothetical protein